MFAGILRHVQAQEFMIRLHRLLRESKLGVHNPDTVLLCSSKGLKIVCALKHEIHAGTQMEVSEVSDKLSDLVKLHDLQACHTRF